MTIGFDSFLALIGPTAAQADKSKNCQIHLNLQYPGGFQYSVVEAVYHGYARLDPGVTGTFLSTYFFSQNPTQSVGVPHVSCRKQRRLIQARQLHDQPSPVPIGQLEMYTQRKTKSNPRLSFGHRVEIPEF